MAESTSKRRPGARCALMTCCFVKLATTSSSSGGRSAQSALQLDRREKGGGEDKPGNAGAAVVPVGAAVRAMSLANIKTHCVATAVRRWVTVQSAIASTAHHGPEPAVPSWSFFPAAAVLGASAGRCFGPPFFRLFIGLASAQRQGPAGASAAPLLPLAGPRPRAVCVCACGCKGARRAGLGTGLGRPHVMHGYLHAAAARKEVRQWHRGGQGGPTLSKQGPAWSCCVEPGEGRRVRCCCTAVQAAAAGCP